MTGVGSVHVLTEPSVLEHRRRFLVGHLGLLRFRLRLDLTPGFGPNTSFLESPLTRERGMAVLVAKNDG